MSEATTKAGKPATKARANKTSAPGKAPGHPAPPAPAPEPAKRRAAAVAKAAPVEQEVRATAVPKAGKSRATQAPGVAQPAVEDASNKARPAKTKKVALVRDSFTMPESEFAAIAVLKKRCLNLGVAAKKSEILRAAVSALAGLSDAEVVAAIRSLDVIKTGRPAKGGK